MDFKFSIIGQEKGDLLIQVPSWAGLTVFQNFMYVVSFLSFIQWPMLQECQAT